MAIACKGGKKRRLGSQVELAMIRCMPNVRPTFGAASTFALCDGVTNKAGPRSVSSTPEPRLAGGSVRQAASTWP